VDSVLKTLLYMSGSFWLTTFGDLGFRMLLWSRVKPQFGLSYLCCPYSRHDLHRQVYGLQRFVLYIYIIERKRRTPSVLPAFAIGKLLDRKSEKSGFHGVSLT